MNETKWHFTIVSKTDPQAAYDSVLAMIGQAENETVEADGVEAGRPASRPATPRRIGR